MSELDNLAIQRHHLLEQVLEAIGEDEIMPPAKTGEISNIREAVEYTVARALPAARSQLRAELRQQVKVIFESQETK